MTGPYRAPGLHVGEHVMDEMRGQVRVHDIVWSGRLAWPRGIRDGRSPGRPGLILIGDLIRAVRQESASAVAEYWGVSTHQVSRWRRALGVGRVTPGTHALFVAHGNMAIGEQAAVGAAALHSDPEASARRAASHSETLRGKPGWAEHMRELAHIPRQRKVQ